MPSVTYIPPGLTTSALNMASGGTDNYVMTAVDGDTIQGEASLQFDGSTLTIGDGETEDTGIIFDGAEGEQYIGLDDGTDALIIGNGTTIGSNSSLAIFPSGAATSQTHYRFYGGGGYTSSGYGTWATGINSAIGLTGHSGDSAFLATMGLGDVFGSSITTAGNTSVAATLYLDEPDITTSHTVTNSAVLYIPGIADEASNDYAIFVDAGLSRFDGGLDMAGSTIVNVGAAGNDWGATAFTHDGAATFNDSGGNYDFRVEGDTNPNMIFVDASRDVISFGTPPSANIQFFASPQAITATADEDFSRARFGAQGILTIPTGTASHVSTLTIEEPWLEATGSGGQGTVTNTSTLRIIGPATEGTNNYALWVDAGASRFDGAISLAADHGDDGQQLTSGGDDAACDWTAASSLREYKDIGEQASPQDALEAMLSTPAYHFHYKDKKGTGDSSTEYVGVMADDAPWAMHYSGKIVNPVNALGYTVLSVQALYAKIEKLEQALGV